MLLELAVAGTFLVLIATIAYALSVFGLFHPIEVKTGKPPYDINGQEVAYKLGRGPYKECGHLFTMLNGDLHRIFQEDRLPHLPMIGFYYGNRPHALVGRVNFLLHSM